MFVPELITDASVAQIEEILAFNGEKINICTLETCPKILIKL